MSSLESSICLVCRALLLQLVLVEARAQDAHRLLAVLVLRALVLAGDHDARRNVRDAHRRIGGVDVLSALAAGAVGVDANVVRLDVDLDALVDFRRDKDAGERGVPALGLVEGRDAHQAMHADLAGQQAVGVFAVDAEGRRLDARLVARLIFVELRLRSPGARPSAGTCASASRPSPATRCRRRRDEWSRWRCGRRSRRRAASRSPACRPARAVDRLSRRRSAETSSPSCARSK